MLVVGDGAERHLAHRQPRRDVHIILDIEYLAPLDDGEHDQKDNRRQNGEFDQRTAVFIPNEGGELPAPRTNHRSNSHRSGPSTLLRNIFIAVAFKQRLRTTRAAKRLRPVAVRGHSPRSGRAGNRARCGRRKNLPTTAATPRGRARSSVGSMSPVFPPRPFLSPPCRVRDLCFASEIIAQALPNRRLSRRRGRRILFDDALLTRFTNLQ